MRDNLLLNRKDAIRGRIKVRMMLNKERSEVDAKKRRKSQKRVLQQKMQLKRVQKVNILNYCRFKKSKMQVRKMIIKKDSQTV